MVAYFKYWLALLLHRSGLLRIIRRRQADRLLILCYHRVFRDPLAMADYFFPGMVISEAMFEQQVRCLAENYQVISLHEAVDRLKSGRRAGGPSVVITFDDGYLDNYLCAYPILRKYHLPATFFLVSGFIGGDSLLWFDKMAHILRHAGDRPEVRALLHEHLPAEAADRAVAALTAGGLPLRERIRAVIGLLKEAPGAAVADLVDALEAAFPEALQAINRNDGAMTWEMALDMQRHGIEIGSHTRTHPILTALPPDRLAEELRDSKRELEKRLGTEIPWFCYPNGNFDAGVQRVLEDFGFRAACSLESGANKNANDLMALKRININEPYARDPWGRFSESLFMAELAGVLDGLLLRRFRRA